jgi:hypothetical protein
MCTGNAITRVFIASPGDVSSERENLTTVINELNTTVRYTLARAEEF